MKVLSKGIWELPEDWRGEVICQRCQSKLEIQLSDLTYHPESGGQWDFSPSYVSCTCPVCSQTITPTVPSHVFAASKSKAGGRY